MKIYLFKKIILKLILIHQKGGYIRKVTIKFKDDKRDM